MYIKKSIDMINNIISQNEVDEKKWNIDNEVFASSLKKKVLVPAEILYIIL